VEVSATRTTDWRSVVQISAKGKSKALFRQEEALTNTGIRSLLFREMVIFWGDGCAGIRLGQADT